MSAKPEQTAEREYTYDEVRIMMYGKPSSLSAAPGSDPKGSRVMVIKLKELPHRTLRQLCRGANRDRDIATITWLGEREEKSQGAVIVIKGAEAARVVAAHLERLKLYTPCRVSDQNEDEI